MDIICEDRITRGERVTIRVTDREREMFHELARRMRRPSYSEVVRDLVREKLSYLQEKSENQNILAEHAN